MLNRFELPNRRPGERVMLTLRRHPVVMFFILLQSLFLVSLPIGLRVFLGYQAEELLNHEIIYPLLLIGASVYYLFIWMFLFNNFIDYYLDVWVVTTDRIINIEQKNLFYRTISEKTLDRMQDITSEVKGILPTFLNYGTVYIQTAGTMERFVFKDVPRAAEITEQIQKIVQTHHKKLVIDQARTAKSNVADIPGNSNDYIPPRPTQRL